MLYVYLWVLTTYVSLPVRLSVGLSVSIIAKFRSTGQCAISSVGRSVCLSVRRSISMQFKKCFSEFRFDYIIEKFKIRSGRSYTPDNTQIYAERHVTDRND